MMTRNQIIESEMHERMCNLIPSLECIGREEVIRLEGVTRTKIQQDRTQHIRSTKCTLTIISHPPSPPKEQILSRKKKCVTIATDPPAILSPLLRCDCYVDSHDQLQREHWRTILDHSPVQIMIMTSLKARFGGDASDVNTGWVATSDVYAWLDDIYYSVRKTYQEESDAESTAREEIMGEFHLQQRQHWLQSFWMRQLIL